MPEKMVLLLEQKLEAPKVGAHGEHHEECGKAC